MRTRVPIEDFDVEFSKAVCTSSVRCGLLPEGTVCAEIGLGSNVAPLQTALNAGRVTYDGAAASDCIAVFAGAGCTYTGNANLSLDRCAEVFDGKVAVGEPCLSSDECVSGSCDIQSCDGTAQCCRGTCASRIPLGGACIPLVNPQCVEGAECTRDATGAHSTCVVPVPALEGQPCRGYNTCAPGLWCAGGTASELICVRFPKRGEACSRTGAPCDSTRDGCDSVTSKCIARGAVGAACTDANNCVAYAVCAPTTKTCVAKAIAGEPCATDTDCQGFLSCEAGTCTKRPTQAVCSLD